MNLKEPITSRNAPLLVLLIGQAGLYLMIATTNVTDLLASAGWYGGSWRSENVDFVQSNTWHVGEPRWLAVLTVVFAATGQMIAGVGFAAAAFTLVRRPEATIGTVRRSVTVSLIVWMTLAVGVELFITYPAANWGAFMFLSLLALGTLWLAEHLDTRMQT
jgi:hypothetical protein